MHHPIPLPTAHIRVICRTVDETVLHCVCYCSAVNCIYAGRGNESCIVMVYMYVLTINILHAGLF